MATIIGLDGREFQVSLEHEALSRDTTTVARGSFMTTAFEASSGGSKYASDVLAGIGAASDWSSGENAVSLCVDRDGDGAVLGEYLVASWQGEVRSAVVPLYGLTRDDAVDFFRSFRFAEEGGWAVLESSGNSPVGTALGGRAWILTGDEGDDFWVEIEAVTAESEMRVPAPGTGAEVPGGELHSVRTSAVDYLVKRCIRCIVTLLPSGSEASDDEYSALLAFQASSG